MMHLSRAALAALLVCWPSPASAQVPVGEPIPLGGETKANFELTYEDEWANVSMAPDGSRYVVAWNDAFNTTAGASTTINARFFDGNGVPLTGDVFVNEFFNANSQDEPMSAVDAFGNAFICWSDRNGNDGSGMGVFGRVVQLDGTPVGPDFGISATTVDSQWEPMPAALPGGGWVVAFNGDNDGDAYLRFLDVDGTPTTPGDVQINTFDNNGQTEAEVRALPDGTVLAVFADFGGNVFPFSGTNLFGRRFDTAGNALDVDVFPLHESTTAFDQLEPRMGNSDDTFVIVWEDRGNDGSGSGIWCRRFDATGTALETEFPVNLVTSNDQFLPEVACDRWGNFVVVWEDWAGTGNRIRARAFDRFAQPLGNGWFVSEGPSGYRRPTVAMSEDGTSVVFAYGGPGGGSSNSQDIYVRRYAWVHTDDGGGLAAPRRRRRPAPVKPVAPPTGGITPILQ